MYVLIYINEYNFGGNFVMDNYFKGVLGEVEVEIFLVVFVYVLEIGDR